MAAEAYLVGRRRRTLDVSSSALEIDSLFCGQRVDGATLSKRVFRHCTFANVSFKSCNLDSVKFENCIFIECYFRQTKIKSCAFSSSRFIDCDMTKVDIRLSEIKYYNQFQGCVIPYNELKDNLPSEGNLRSHLCQNLATEARNLGLINDSELYAQDAASAQERHLRNAFMHTSEYYREKYRGGERVAAFSEWLASRARGFLWGYRRSYLVVLRNWLALTLVIFPVAFWMLRDGINQGQSSSPFDYLTASLGNMLPGSGISSTVFTSPATQLVAFLEVLIGLVFVGLVVTLLFRSVFERRR